ncbi:MAG: helix-turn-helix domain-containing protein [Paludibacter sp.]
MRAPRTYGFIATKISLLLGDAMQPGALASATTTRPAISVPPGHGGPVSIDTRSVPPQERLEFWRRAVSEVDGIMLQCDTSNFVARLRKRSFGRCSIYQMSTETPHRVTRSALREDLCFINIQMGTRYAMFSGIREYPLTTGTMAVYEANHGYHLDFFSESDSVVLGVKKSLLETRVVNLQDHLEQSFKYDETLVGALATLCKNMLVDDRVLSEAINDDLTQSVLSLLSATMRQATGDQPHSQTWGQSAILQRMKEYVQHHMQDPDLDPARIADAMGITVGYLHKIYRTRGSSVMRYVLSERLEKCRIDLARCERIESISQIAFKWGFNDASHFTRSFRQQFGMSPREYRRRALQQQDTFGHATA